MKLFIIQNWYRLVTGTAMLLVSVSFLIFALKHNTTRAGTTKSPFTINTQQEKIWVVGCGNHVYEVTWNAFQEKYEFKIIGPEQEY